MDLIGNGYEGTMVPPSLLRTMRDFIDVLQPKYWVTPKLVEGLPQGDGHPVLFAPGLGSGDFATAPVRKFYQQLGYRTHGWEQGLNVGPTRKAIGALERNFLELSDEYGERVSLVGRSLGGVYLRELAKKHPDRVRRLILVCSPVKHPVPSHLATLLHLCDRLYDPSFPREPRELSKPAPVPTTSFYTRIDGYIAWQCCLEEPSPLVENIELPSARHCTAALHPIALRVVAERLAIRS